MTNGPNDILSQRLSGLRAAYAEHLPERVRAIEEGVSALGTGDAEALRALYHQVHRLTGSAAVYGFPQLSRASAVLEERLLAAWQGETPAAAEDASSLAPLVAALKQELPAALATLAPPRDAER